MMVYTRTNETDKSQNTTNVAVIWIVMMARDKQNKQQILKHCVTGSYCYDGIHQDEWNRQVSKHY